MIIVDLFPLASKSIRLEEVGRWMMDVKTRISLIWIARAVNEDAFMAKDGGAQFSGNYAPDNVDLARQPINIG